MKIDVVIESGVLQFKQMDGYEDGIYEVEIKNLDTRTNQQNKALYLYMTMIANTLNRENIPTSQVLKMDINWTADKVKHMIVRPLMEALFSIKSTTKLKKGDFDILIDTLTKAMGQRGISMPPFPNKGAT